MSDEVIKILDALADKFGIAIDWTSANVIPYLQQLCKKSVSYEMTTSIIWLLIGICLFLGGVYGIKQLKKCYAKGKECEKAHDWNEAGDWEIKIMLWIAGQRH